MKGYLPYIFFFAATIIASCKSTSGIGDYWSHGVDVNGNVYMTPPPPGQGIQINVLPFPVPDSTEVQGDFYFDLPSDVDFSVGRIEIAMNEGSHQMNCYKTISVWPADSGLASKTIMHFDNGNADTIITRFQNEFNTTIVRTNGNLIIESQLPYLNWTLPELNSGTDSAKQKVIQLSAKQHMVVESHYVNIANFPSGGSQVTPNGKGAIIINLWKANSSEQLVPASMLYARKTDLIIPPHSDTSDLKDCTFPGLDPTKFPIYLMAMTGHFNSRGKNFRIDKIQNITNAQGKVIGDSVSQTGIYKSSSWDESLFTVYDPPVQLNKNQFIRIIAEYANNTNYIILFGPHVSNQERCDLFSWFVPAYNGGQTIYDDQN